MLSVASSRVGVRSWKRRFIYISMITRLAFSVNMEQEDNTHRVRVTSLSTVEVKLLLILYMAKFDSPGVWQAEYHTALLKKIIHQTSVLFLCYCKDFKCQVKTFATCRRDQDCLKNPAAVLLRSLTLTALSMPKVSNMMKNTMAQNVEPGSVEMASG